MSGEFGDDADESVDAATEFGEYDFDDSGGVGWKGFGDDGGLGCWDGWWWVKGVWVGSSTMDGWL